MYYPLVCLLNYLVTSLISHLMDIITVAAIRMPFFQTFQTGLRKVLDNVMTKR